jgi:hypothetical protein
VRIVNDRLVSVTTSVFEEGIKALVPGAGVVVDPAHKLLEPQLAKVERWRHDKAEAG